MRRKKSLLIPAVLAFSLCTGAVVPVLAEETSQTADAADNEQEAHTQSATDTSDSPYEKGTMAESEIHTTGNSSHEYRGRASVCYEAGTDHPRRIFRRGAWR